MPDISITIADVPIELHSPLSAAELGIVDRLGSFFGRPAAPSAPVELRWEESAVPPSPRGEQVYDPGLIWRMHHSARGYEAVFDYSGARVEAVLTVNPTWDNAVLTEQRYGPNWGSLLCIGAGELLLRTRILLNAGLVFHASGLDDNGSGVVFVGHSGAGKSTQIGLWNSLPGVVAMNDDRIAIRTTDGGTLAYGTPWGGTLDIARNHQAPLKAIMVLEQAPENAIERLSPTVATPLLMARAFLPYWDRGLMQRALANLDAIVARVPVYRLRCRPEMAVIPLVRSVL